MPRLIFVRHGESEANSAARHNDDETKLTAIGREQAKKTGAFLSKNFRHVKQIFTSPITRAMQTVQAMDLKVPVKKLDLLREADNGLIKGLTEAEIFALPRIGKKFKKYQAEIKAMSPMDIFLATEEFISLDNKIAKLLRAESDADIAKRAKAAMEKILSLADASSDEIVIVSHAGMIRYMLGMLNNISPAGIGNRFAYVNGKHISNCSISIVSTTLDDIGARKNQLNLMLYTGHLA